MSDSAFLPVRPRRLRLRPELRAMLQRVHLRRSDIIVPVFVTEGVGVRKEVGSMPGVFQMSTDVALDWLSRRAEEGFKSYLIFGVIDRAKKDPMGSPALDPENVVCNLLRQDVGAGQGLRVRQGLVPLRTRSAFGSGDLRAGIQVGSGRRAAPGRGRWRVGGGDRGISPPAADPSTVFG